MSTDGTLSTRKVEATEPIDQTNRPQAESAGRSPNLQEAFLNRIRRDKLTVTVFLIKGVKLQGVVTWFDNFSILLRRDGQSQLIYKHAISTVVPGQPIDESAFETPAGNRKQRVLQDVFLARVLEAGTDVTMFLVNGVMLQGCFQSYDQFSILLERQGAIQLVYKHAISTVQPVSPVDLHEDTEGGQG